MGPRVCTSTSSADRWDTSWLSSSPLSLAVAILRYRLWDIDVLINRALVYGLLSAMLGAVYLGSVVVLQAGFRTVTGQESTLALVVSTLAIAALFQPLRRKVQGVIDRRFYRRRYDAARTLASFGAVARNEVDIEPTFPRSAAWVRRNPVRVLPI